MRASALWGVAGPQPGNRSSDGRGRRGPLELGALVQASGPRPALQRTGGLSGPHVIWEREEDGRVGDSFLSGFLSPSSFLLLYHKPPPNSAAYSHAPIL